MSHRTGKSYLRPVIRIRITDPTTHRLKRTINQLRREINQATQTAAHFGFPLPAWVGERQKKLTGLEQQLKGVTQ